MPIVCINRPNRKNPRVFTAKDVARIARYAKNDGADPIKMIAAVLISLGLGAIVCKAAKAASAGLILIAFIKKVVIIIGTSKIVEILISILSSRLVRKIPRLNLIALALVVVLTSLMDVIKATVELVDDADNVEEGAGFIRGLCAAIVEVGEDLLDN